MPDPHPMELDLCTVSAFSDPRLVKVAQDQIGKDIQNLLQQICTLKRRANELVSVSRLPSEVLSQIFIVLRDGVHQSIDERHDLSWIVVSHVCSYWRAVALACPRLWSRIVICSSPFTTEMLLRSKMVPLAVAADLNVDEQMVVALALVHFWRIRELHLVANSTFFRLALPTGEQRSADLLESLHLENFAPGDAGHLRYLRGIAMPRLKHVELVGCSLDWDSLRSSITITHLELCTIPPEGRPTLKQLLAILDSLPKLEKLMLVHALSIYPAPGSSTQLVSLPHLSNLFVHDRPLHCADLLSYLTISRTTITKIDCAFINLTDFDETVTRLLRTVADSCMEAYDSLFFTKLADDEGMIIQSWDTEKPVFGGKQGYCQITLNFQRWNGQMTGYTTAIACQTLPLERLKKLGLNDMRCVTKTVWTVIARYLQGVKSVLTTGQPPYGFFETLLGAKTETQQSAFRPSVAGFRANTCFPRLESLFITRADFKDRVSFGENMLGDVLRALLLLRYNQRNPIKRLYIDECENIPLSEIALLRELVPRLYWDGQGGRDDPLNDDYLSE